MNFRRPVDMLVAPTHVGSRGKRRANAVRVIHESRMLRDLSMPERDWLRFDQPAASRKDEIARLRAKFNDDTTAARVIATVTPITAARRHITGASQ